MNETTNDESIASALRELPQLDPPGDGWERIVAALNNDGAPGDELEARRRAVSRWSLGIGLAASVCAGIWMMVMARPTSDAEVFTATPPPEVAAVAALQRQSELLEELLRLTPRASRVTQVGYASRTTAVEDRIAAIDQTLLTRSDELDAEALAELWSERTAMMNALVRLRISESAETSL